MLVARWAWCAALLALAAARRSEQDFEFDDAADVLGNALSDAEAHARASAGADADADGGADASAGGGEAAVHARRPHRYLYDPHNALCRALACGPRQLCVLREAGGGGGGGGALCATRNDILRRGDVIVTGGAGGGGGGGAADEADADADDGDVFYDAEGAPARPADAAPAPPDRCVGCGGGGGGGGGGDGFLCGSDNRTYSSLCRLDLHNCVRRAAPPVALACRGFCPCARARARPRARRPRPPRPPRPAAREWARRGVAPEHREVPREGQAEGGEAARNSLRARAARRNTSAQENSAGAGCALDQMADRLLDWFSVLMEQARAHAPPPAGFAAGCKREVRWMFAHLDADGDGRLSASELYALRHDERERCLRPFLASCGGGGGGGGGAGAAGGVTRGEWCACLRRAARPCTALARAAAAAAAGRGARGFAPACDARGFYRPRQCHAALAVCWCVDPHGAELPGTRARGRVRCPPRAPAPPPAPAPAAPPSDDEDADAAGSGDAELLY